MAQTEAAQDGKSLLQTLLYDGKMVRDPKQESYAKDLVEEFATQVLDESMTIKTDTAAMINARISELDDLITKQLNAAWPWPAPR